MRIAIDLQSCQSGSRLGGIGRYSLELAKAMIRSSQEDDFLIVMNDRNPSAEAAVRRECRNILSPDRFRIFSAPANCSYLHDGGKIAGAAEAIREQFLTDLNPDFVHLSSLFEGFLDDVVTSVRRTESRVPVAVTLYDLIPIAQKELYLIHDLARIHYFEKFEQLKRATAILAISDYSAREGVELMKNYNGVVTDIRGGIDGSFRPIRSAAEGMKGFLAKHKIGNKFILYTASFDQRKNQKKLIEAFAQMPSGVRKAYTLVMVGNGWPDVYADLKMAACASGLSENDIVFPGHVTDSELVGLYNICSLFVFPSLWEGLGLPVLEAMACGAVVIGSNTTSLPEVLGWEEASFNPNDVRAISKKMEKALVDKEFRDELKTRAAAHVKEFTWAESAKRSLDAIRLAHRQENTSKGLIGTSIRRLPSAIESIRENSHSDTSNWEYACCMASNELEAKVPWTQKAPLKLGWMSSWGTRCGIASYSENLLRHSSIHTEMLAPKVLGEIDDAENVSRLWWVGKDDDLSEVIDKVHRLELTDLVIQFNYGFYNFEALNKLVKSCVSAGCRVYIVLHSTQDDQHVYGHRLSDIRQALNYANYILVHSEKDIERLQALGITSHVVQIPQGVRLLSPTKEVVKNPNLITSYGFFLPGKGLPELVETVAVLHEQGHKNLRLRMVNADYGARLSEDHINEVKAKARALGVYKSIDFVTDYLEDSESLALLREASAIVYPYQKTGESSSAAVRMGLAAGIPVLVTPLDIFSDVKNATFALPGIEPKQMAEGIIKFRELALKNDSQITETLLNAEGWCASHNVENVSNFLFDLIRREAASEVWAKVLSPAVELLPLKEGELDGKIIRSVRGGGLLMYGPYASLDAGFYRLVVKGDAYPPEGEADNKCACTLTLTSDFGAKAIKIFEIVSGNDGIILDTYLRFDQPVVALELVINYPSRANIALLGYEFIRRVARV